ncbi:MAG TPA: EamA family transporter RarD, partial [Micromonosporaceae bacterium]
MDQRRGYLSAFAAYALWGFFPIYFHHLLPAGALEILAHRVIWSVVTVAVIITALRRWRDIAELRRRPRKLAGLGLAAVLIGVNWFVYIYGVNSNQVIETSLGYFI